MSPAQRMRSAVFTLALYSAKKAVKRQLQAQGLKVAHYSARDITILAERYLNDHRTELIAEAKETVECWVAEGFFGKRAQRVWAETDSVSNPTRNRTLDEHEQWNLRTNQR